MITYLAHEIFLRPLEQRDLPHVHEWNNSIGMMRYWFEEPYESFDELKELYIKHIHDQSERRFIIANNNVTIGLIELTEIDFIHRKAEFGILIDPQYQGKGYGFEATKKALDHAFGILNLHKIYLLVDERNENAVHLYKKAGFLEEAKLIDEFFVDGAYRAALRMYILSTDHQRAER
jgi:diamine N-acetyltransferase